MSELRILRLPHNTDLPLPAYQTADAAGMDLMAAVIEPVILPVFGRALIPTGLAMAIPSGFEAQVRPRSGLAARQGVTVLNSPGTIDADYRGEVKVILINLGSEPVTISRGDRVAQIVIAPVSRLAITEVSDLEDTARGSGGFGSTGVSKQP